MMDGEAARVSYPEMSGKVAVVTGGSGGIGSAVCRALADNGAKVAVNGRDEARIERVVRGLRASGAEAVGVAADCADSTAVERMRREVESSFGLADILIAFAGGGIARPGPTVGVTDEEWRSTMEGNLTATFYTLRAFLPAMTGRGSGSVVTMASSAARIPTGAPVPYAAAKAAVISLTRSVANEVGASGVRVNCLSPAGVLTEHVRENMPDEIRERREAATPLGRLGEPEDIARAALFLASETSAWIAGITLDVAGVRSWSEE